MSTMRVAGWFEILPGGLSEVANIIRDLLLEASPLIKEKWKYHLPFYSHRRWMCYLSLQKHRFVLGFVAGAHLLDPEGLFPVPDHRLIRRYLPTKDVSDLPT